jgi:hypothetical protein
LKQGNIEKGLTLLKRVPSDLDPENQEEKEIARGYMDGRMSQP